MRTPPATMSTAARTSRGPIPSARFRRSADQTTAHSDSVAYSGATTVTRPWSNATKTAP